ncbi:hypothetical protein GGS21DRAFT_120494 [Xylaria nigripes]|nr:hypothetical protein GGS21DRAFT_120494 [Xylaria nigripes]
MEPDFDFSAFDLTAGERRAVLGEIKAVLLQTGARITRAGKSENSDDEYHDALVQIDDVLALASDPDACDPALAPLATCHYYRGQILFALDRQEEAYHEFNLAASSKPHTPTDAPAIRDATQRLAELEQYGRRTESTESTGSGAGPVRRDSVRYKQVAGPHQVEKKNTLADLALDQEQKSKLANVALHWADDIEPTRGGPANLSGAARRRTVIVETNGQVTMFTPRGPTT